MNPTSQILLCALAVGVLCQCTGGDDKKAKKKDTSNMPLAQRSMLKPDENQRSRFEKFITDPKAGKGGAGNYFQKQVHHSNSFSGGNSYAGQKQFKAGQSWFGKSRAQGMDTTYSLGNRQSSMAGEGFDAGQSKLGARQSRDGASVFGGSDSIFKTGNALTRSAGAPKPPKIIENYNDMGGGKSAYSEDEVRRLINRN
ncbi:MAG: hypothetical protein R3F13_21605 [Prosthecobacter sp.]